MAFLQNNKIITNFNNDSQMRIINKETWFNYKELQMGYNYQRFLFKKTLIIDNNIIFPNYRRYQDPPFLVKAMSVQKNSME